MQRRPKVAEGDVVTLFVGHADLCTSGDDIAPGRRTETQPV